MVSRLLRFESGRPAVVGSIGNAAVLQDLSLEDAHAACDIVEIRLDGLAAESALDRRNWQHLVGMPLLFTARRQEEGGMLSSTAEERAAWLEVALEDAAVVDIEVASLLEMSGIVARILVKGIPLVASFHDFSGTPEPAVWKDRLEIARAHGATVFKAAARLHGLADLQSLASFQAIDHGMPVAMMGMGPLAPVSRLLCAQHGSVLNYGYLGDVPTAPGQWSAAKLKGAISSLEMIRA
jgi:3-dehydroquinate dehydratase-1